MVKCHQIIWLVKYNTCVIKELDPLLLSAAVRIPEIGVCFCTRGAMVGTQIMMHSPWLHIQK